MKLRQNQILTGAVVCLALMFIGHCQLACAQRSEKKTSLPLPHKVPLALFRGALIFAQARLNNSEPLWFLVDTASSFSFLDQAQAETLGIKSAGQNTITGGGGGAIDFAMARGITLDVAGMKLANQTFAITNWRNRYDRNVVGMLGAPFLEQFVVELDFQAQQLTLHDPQRFAYNGKGAVLPLDFSDGLPTLHVGLTVGTNKPFTAKLHLDTGASQTIILNADCVEAHNLLASTAGMLKVEAGSMAGKVNYYIGRAQAVKLGQFVFADMIANYAPRGGFKVNPGIDGVLGNGILKRFKVILDYPRKRLILELSELYPVPYDYEMTGMIVNAVGKEFKVAEVIKASAAGDAGVQSEDVILAVNDRPTTQMNLAQLRQIFKQDGSANTLTVKRGAETQQLTLKMLQIK